jgi:hypothetical protein
MALPVVHGRGDLGHVPVQVGIGELWHTRRPGVPVPRRQVAGHLPDPGVKHRG